MTFGLPANLIFRLPNGRAELIAYPTLKPLACGSIAAVEAAADLLLDKGQWRYATAQEELNEAFEKGLIKSSLPKEVVEAMKEVKRMREIQLQLQRQEDMDKANLWCRLWQKTMEWLKGTSQ